jgi:hypothetical protein
MTPYDSASPSASDASVASDQALSPGDTPGGRILGRILYQLSTAVSSEAVSHIISAHAFFFHRTRAHTPQVILKNGFLFTLPFQSCGNPDCSKQGFTVRQWSQWWRARGWHPPMSVSSRPPTMLLLSPHGQDCFGPPFGENF